jgi:hypothetical protein
MRAGSAGKDDVLLTLAVASDDMQENITRVSDIEETKNAGSLPAHEDQGIVITINLTT